MANTVTVKKLQEGARNLVYKIDIVGDGSGEVTAQRVINTSLITDLDRNIALMFAQWANDAFAATLHWHSAGGAQLQHCPAGYGKASYIFANGVTDPSGEAGEVYLTTNGLGSGERGTLFLTFRK